MNQPIIRGTIQPITGDVSNPQTIVLGSSLGTTTALWDRVVPALSNHYRVLRFDLPGHGLSPAALEPFTVADVADAVITLVDSADGGTFHYAGISFAGAVGLELALRHPDRLRNLAVICSGAKIGAAESWLTRATQIRASGTASVVAGSAERWFAPGFLERDPAAGSAALGTLLDVDDESYALCCDALATFDVTGEVHGIRSPTLCASGEFDLSTPPAQLQELAARIPGARHVTIAEVGHLPALERPDTVAALLLEFLAPRSEPTARATAEDTYAAGLAVRRSVLGDAHVDAATAAITPETTDFQDFITRYAWGEIWTRPGLDRRTRSFLTIASLVTGGHVHELALHVRAALRNGLTRAEISEAILHTAIYAGVPAANSAIAVARDTFAAIDSANAESPTRS